MKIQSNKSIPIMMPVFLISGVLSFGQEIESEKNSVMGPWRIVNIIDYAAQLTK